MKSIIFYVLLLIPLCSFAQSDSYFKKKYVNLGFVNETLEQDGKISLKSNYGASFSVGRTFYVHKNPFAKIIKFGIDVTWFDITYTNYDVTHITYWDTKKFQIHEGEVGMQVGPSLTVNPVSKMNIHLYFRYAPSFSCYYADDEFQSAFANYLVGGGSFSYGAIGLGIEWRHGSSKFEPMLNWDNISDSAGRIKTKTNGLRIYVTFKF